MFWALGRMILLLGLVVVETRENHENTSKNHENTLQTMFWAVGLLVLLGLGVVDDKISRNN